MKKMRNGLIMLLSATLILSGCASMNKTQKGAVIGTATGAAMGAVIGETAGNAAMGAIIGAAVGGAAGAIIGKGINESRLTIKGFGETVPKYTNDTAEGRALNRRVEFLITANEKMKAAAEKEAAN